MDGDLDARALERRATAVRAVRQVVHAIWVLARAQLPLVRNAASEAAHYVEWVDSVVSRLAAEQPLGSERAPLYVVFGPERAFCGALPRTILNQIPERGRLGFVGRRLAELAGTDPGTAARTVFRIDGATAHEDHGAVAERVAHAVLECVADSAVQLLYPTEGGATLHRAPLLGGSGRHELPRVATLSPHAEVLEHALQEAVAGRLAVSSAEALWAEVEARAAAAARARKACDSKQEDLLGSLRALRQEEITNEILEVAGGRLAALEEEAR